MSLGYIDPASGSMLLQRWRRVLRILHIRKPEDDESAEPVSAAHESETLDPVREPAGKR